MVSQQTKRFRTNQSESTQERQLSGLFGVISNNLLVAIEVLNNDCHIDTIEELEILSKKARRLSEELNSDSVSFTDDELSGRVSSLKHRMLQLIIDLSDDLSKQAQEDSESSKKLQGLILARRLLRDARRGLVTIRD